jgi:transcriptional regulator with XRE-family HTH domain
MSIYKIFAQNLREECTRFESIAEVCRGSGINRQQFNKYLSGSTIPNVRTLERMCSYFKIEDSQLFARIEDKGKILHLTPQKNSSSPTSEDPLITFLHSINPKGIFPQYAPPINEIAEGFYNCYFPLEGFPNFLVRSILKIRVVNGAMRFIRHTRMRSPHNRRGHIAFGKHHGVVLDDNTSLLLLGRNSSSPHNITTIYVVKGPMYGLRIKSGLALLLGITTSFACRVCIESIGSSHTELRKALLETGITALDDPSISSAVRSTMAQTIESSSGILGPPSIDKILGLDAPV